jgi:hypothetical protein
MLTFDRDAHLTYYEALSLAKSLDSKLHNDARQVVKFKAIASIPNFELWLLLHFEDIHTPLHRDEVIQRLKRHMPGYAKGAGGVFPATRMHLATATNRAERLAARFHAYQDSGPFTDIAGLVTLLTGLR